MKRAYPAAQRKPSVTWPPLSSGQHNVWLISVLQLHIWSLWKALSTRRPQQHISSQSKLHKRKKKESADAVELSSWISGKVFFFFPPLYHPVDSFSDSYKTHPTLVSVFHWIGWRYLLYWLTLRNCFEQISQISRVKHSNIFKHERYVEKR